MPRLTPRFFAIFGTLFISLGSFTLINILGSITLGGELRDWAVAYVVANFALAYAFFTKQPWLLYALGLNWTTFSIIALLTTAANPSLLLVFALGFLLNAIIFFITWSLRSLLNKKLSLPAAVAFFAAWAYSVGFSLYNVMR